jgi:acyl dehydratase
VFGILPMLLLTAETGKRQIWSALASLHGRRARHLEPVNPGDRADALLFTLRNGGQDKLSALRHWEKPNQAAGRSCIRRVPLV